MRKPRVMRIIARLNVGGPARHVIWLTSRLGDRFDRILVAGHVESNEAEMTALARAEKVEPIYVKGLGRSIGPWDIIAFLRILRLMSDFDPDIVHTHTSKGGFLGRAAAWVLNLTGRNIRTIHTFHGHVLHGYFSYVVTHLFVLLERLLGFFATDRVLTISRQQFGELSTRFQVAQPDKFRLVPIAIDLDEFKSRNAQVAPDGPVRIALVGRLTAIKDPMMFLEAGRIVQTIAPKAELIIVGDGEMREEMTAVAPPGTTFLGNRDDIHQLMPTFDVLVISSRNEGTPVSVLEAFASGVVVCATMAGGCVDLLADGRGLLSPIGDADRLAANILRCIREPDLVASTRARAHDYVHANHSLERLVRDIESLYDEVSAPPRQAF